MANFFNPSTTTKTISLTVIIATLMTPILSGAMEIRQEEFRYAMNVAQDIACTTFVITDMPSSAGRRTTIVMQPPPIQFRLGSAVLATEEAENLMTWLRKGAITKNTPLVVTGHSCPLGPEQLNQTLSLQRAMAVATLLRDWGFTVADVRGKGSQAPVTTDPRQLFLNRRVEITAASQDHEVNPVFQGR
ncbi:MAG: OmpA family protein [Desulfobulbaceae bacterium]